VKVCTKIIQELKNYKKVTQVIKQFIQYFKVEKFIEKLDQNRHLLCFKEYFYDLKQCKLKQYGQWSFGLEEFLPCWLAYVPASL